MSLQSLLLQLGNKGQRPPSPPRQLKDLSNSSILTKEFEDYLKIEVDEKNENQSSQILLAFVMQCDKLRKTKQKKEAQQILLLVGKDFFNNPVRSNRVALKNSALRQDLQQSLSNPITDDVPSNLWKAESDAFLQLDTHYQNFLQKRHQDRHRQNSLTACLL